MEKLPKNIAEDFAKFVKVVLLKMEKLHPYSIQQTPFEIQYRSAKFKFNTIFTYKIKFRINGEQG